MSQAEQFLELVNKGKILIDHFPMAGVIDQCREWMWEGWGIPQQADNITPPMIAAALFNEAGTQDKCVEAGETHPDYPRRLRNLAFSILERDGHKDTRTPTRKA